MRIIYSVIITASLISTILFIIKAKKESSTAAIRIKRMLISACFAEFANLVIALPFSVPYPVTVAGFSMYFTSIDWILFFLLGFTISYSNSNIPKFLESVILKIVFLCCVLDSLSLLSCPFTEVPFSFHLSKYLDETYMFVDMHPLYATHLIFSYILVVLIFILLILSISKSVDFYKNRFLAPLIIVSSIVVINAIYMLFELPLDFSVILYSISGILVHYYAFTYMPRTLITKALRITTDSLSEGLILFDINDNCLYLNQSAKDMFDLSEENFNASHYPVTEWIGNNKNLQSVGPFESQFSTQKENDEIQYKLSLNHITDKKGRYLGCYFLINDITKEYRIMRALESSRKQADHAKEEADRANKAKGAFLANMSHEIRTPINAILGMNEMILRADVSPEVRDFANNIQTSGDALLSLINDILDFSKIESGKMELQVIDYEPYSILRSCQTMIFPRIKDKNIDLKITANSSCPKVLSGDEVRIRQILTNLCTNAAKYTHNGSITISLDWMPVDNNTGTLILSVSDTGIGISEENINKLFNAFERIDEKTNRNIEGTGLGLSITYELVQLMNGTIDVESTFGKGSVFTVRIPQPIVSPEASGTFKDTLSAPASTYKELFRAPAARILAVDDYKMNLVVLKGLLKKTEVQLTTVSGGTEALDLLGKETFDLILLDHMMPGMDGIETFHKLKEMDSPNSDIPVIMLTANAISGVEQQYLAEGFSGYLSKPINSSELEKTLLKFLPKEKVLQ